MLSRGRGRPNWLRVIWQFLRIPRFDPLDLINGNKSVLGFNLSYLFSEQGLMESAMERIGKWYAEGALRAPAVTQYALDDVALAHAALQSGTTMGKLTLVPRLGDTRAAGEKR
jgi:NADPH:quinone reductase-like Zn-dependent oxidoreductase